MPFGEQGISVHRDDWKMVQRVKQAFVQAGAIQTTMVQTFLMKLARTRNSSTVPQPRKASHPIIAARTIAMSNPTTAFLILRAEADRALVCGSGT